MGTICTEKLAHFLVFLSRLFSPWNSLALSKTSCYSYLSQLFIDHGKLCINIASFKNVWPSICISNVFGDTIIDEIIFSLCFYLVLLYLSHCVHINTAKVNILKSCPRLCPLSLSTRTKLFSSLFQETITALKYLPGIKCWWVPVSSGWHLFHQRSQSRRRGGTEGREEKELLAYPANGCGGIVKQSRLPSR